ncbi:MAG TPA: hypothetical protein ENI23_04060 [bacterium]|nr:hypothetical protein [bacterium]
MTREKKKESRKTKILGHRSNEILAYLNAMTVVSVIFNDGRKYDNVPLTEVLDKLLSNNKKRRRS